MVVAPGAYLIVIPNACKNPSAPLRRHFGRAQRDLESVTSRILGLNRFRVPLTLRVIGPGMTNGVDAHGAVRMLPNRHFGRAQRDPELVTSRILGLNRFRVPLTLRVIGPGMTNGVDAHGAVRMLPSRHSGRAQRDPESVTSRILGLNRFRVPLTLRVIGPGMTNGVDAHGAVRLLPNRHSGRAQRDPESVTSRILGLNRFRVPLTLRVMAPE